MTDGIEKIERLLRGVQKPTFSARGKRNVKTRLMSSVFSDAKAALYVREVSSKISLAPVERVAIKERLFEIISGIGSEKVFIGFSSFAKKLVSASVVGAFLMGFVGFVSVDINVALAESFTTIEDVSGDVTVVRGGQFLSAYPDMELFEGDKVKTGDDGFASITFLDDSVIRLSNESDISIQRLFADPLNKALTYVKVEVENGNVWSRVLNLVDDDSAFVVKAKELYALAKKAAFDIKVEGDEASLSVYQHVVDIKTPQSNDSKILTGQKVTTTELESKVEKLGVVGENDKWVKENLASDKVYIAKVNEKKKENREETASGSQTLQDLKTGVVKFLTFDDVDKEKIDFEQAQKRFIEVEVDLEAGKIKEEDAKIVFDEFIAQVDEFKNLIADVRQKGDEVYASELKKYLSGKLSGHKKDLGAILPDSPLYSAKVAILDAEMASAEDKAEEVMVQAGQASLKLGEVSDLVEAGKTEMAQEALNDYTETVQESSNGASILPDDEKASMEERIAEVKKEGVDVLNSIQKVGEGVAEGNVAEVEGVEIGAAEAGTAAGTAASTAAGTAEAVPIQQLDNYGVPVSGSGDGEKPLDPLLNVVK